jgi:hypothetical protein
MHTNFVDVLIKRNIIYYLIFLSSIYSYLFFLCFLITFYDNLYGISFFHKTQGRAKIWFFLLLCWVGIHSGIYKNSYNVSNIWYLDSPPPLLTLIPPHSWNRFNRCHFVFAYICTQYLHLIHLHTLFSHYLPPPTGNCHTWAGPISPSSDFVEEKEKNDIFACFWWR